MLPETHQVVGHSYIERKTFLGSQLADVVEVVLRLVRVDVNVLVGLVRVDYVAEHHVTDRGALLESEQGIFYRDLKFQRDVRQQWLLFVCRSKL